MYLLTANYDLIIVFATLALTIFLFITEWLRVDLVALLAMVVLMLTGVLTPKEGVAGFSNPATVTVAAMFVMSAALYKTGMVGIVGKKLALLFRYNFWIGMILMMIAAGVMSAFINNTSVVAIFIPIVIGAARSAEASPSTLLMPLSFASIFGGVCTLIGTSTNLLISGIAEESGLPAFSMFEMTPLGIIFFGTGILYMLLIGIRLIPKKEDTKELAEKFGLEEYLAEIVLLPESPSAGLPIKDSPLVKDLEIDIIEVKRKGGKFFLPSPHLILNANDELRVRGNIEKIKALQKSKGIAMKAGKQQHQEKGQGKESDEEKSRHENKTMLVEAVVAPDSMLEGVTMERVGFRARFGATALALRHRGTLMRENLARTPLRAGDTILMEIDKENLQMLRQRSSRNSNPFILISDVGLMEYKPDKIFIVLAVIIAMVTAASLNIIPIMTGAVAGCGILVLTRCLDMREAYKAIEWKIVFLLAGMLSLGAALYKTGAADLLSDHLINYVGGYGLIVLVSVIYLLTSLLTETMSNNASAALLAPIAIQTAQNLQIDSRPLLMAIAFAASASFMTPIGYQTNTMIYGAGQYKFADFLKVGGPLNLLFWILATFLIPYFFPF
ncbi:MAG TPA: SLC13 family permease [Adhaeribacter sp.]|nr:SLC13 family permease [Adhaeribacter sp.]